MSQIRSIGIVGTGIMGIGIARCAALCGFNVTIVKWTPGDLMKVRMKFYEGVEKQRADGKLSMQEHMALKTKIAWSANPEDLADRDLVIESIVEDVEAKLDCLATLETHVGPEAILASNTSSIPLDELACALKRPERFVGMHFFNPVAKMRLVEIAGVAATVPSKRERVFEFAERLGKEAVLVPASTGFVVNRLLVAQMLEAIRMAFEGEARGAHVASVDACMRLGVNHPMGPFELMDLIGIDVVCAMAMNLQEGLRAERFSPPVLLERMVERNWLGRKTGIGFYDYADRADPRANPGVRELVSGP